MGAVVDTSKKVKSFPRRFVEEATTSIRKDVLGTLKRDTGGDLVLSGTTRRGVRTRLRVNKNVKGTTNASGTVRPGPRGRGAGGMWSWLEYGTAEPGPTAAKHTWSRATEPGIERVQRMARTELREVV